MSQPQTPRSIDHPATDAAAQRLLRRILRQWWLIAAAAVIAGSAAFAYSASKPKTYEATSTIEVSAVDLLTIFLSRQMQRGATDADRLKAAAIETFQLPNVRDGAVAILKAPPAATPPATPRPITPATAQELEQQVRVESKPDSSVLSIVARDEDPVRAQNMSRAMVDSFIQQRRIVARKKIIEEKAQVTRQLESIQTGAAAATGGITEEFLQQRLRDLGVVGATADGNVTKIEEAPTPTEPVGPRPARSAVLGFLLGGFLGLAAAALRARRDDRIRDAEEFDELWGLPLVGLVPNSSSLKDSGPSIMEPAVLEAVSLARSSLRYLHVGGSIKVVAITSASEGEGKSTIAWCLAVSTALAGGRVIVIDADLRRPKLSSRLEISGEGLSAVLAGITDAASTIRTIPVDGATTGASTGATVDVIPAGMVPPNPIALLEDPALPALLEDLRGRYDLVVVDTPPVTAVADAVALAEAVDGFVMISRLGTVKRRAYARTRDVLGSLPTPVIGQIVNGDRSAGSYGYYSSDAPKRS